MEVGSPEWIEASLAKLEQLEQQRAKHEHAIETAKAWARGVPRTERATTLETCRAMGVTLKAAKGPRERPGSGSGSGSGKKPPEKCADPMECRK